MNTTLFLAQVFGLYFLIGGLGLILKQSSLKSLIARFSSDSIMLMMGGFVALIIGIPLVLIHNVWGSSLEIIVSLIAWAAFVKGFTLVLMPELTSNMMQSLSDNIGLLKVMLWLMVILGGYLTYVGFGM
jgi:hypothetical protein